jgi:hypothetical protein
MPTFFFRVGIRLKPTIRFGLIGCSKIRFLGIINRSVASKIKNRQIRFRFFSVRSSSQQQQACIPRHLPHESPPRLPRPRVWRHATPPRRSRDQSQSRGPPPRRLQPRDPALLPRCAADRRRVTRPALMRSRAGVAALRPHPTADAQASPPRHPPVVDAPPPIRFVLARSVSVLDFSRAEEMKLRKDKVSVGEQGREGMVMGRVHRCTLMQHKH